MRIIEESYVIFCKEPIVTIKLNGEWSVQKAMEFGDILLSECEKQNWEKHIFITDLRHYIIPGLNVSVLLNNSMKRLAVKTKLKYNALIVTPDFKDVIQMYFQYVHLKETGITSKAFSGYSSALDWIQSMGFSINSDKKEEIVNFASKSTTI